MQYSYPDPWSISPTLAPEIARHGLESNVAQLREEGYTIVEDAYSREFCASLRNTILRVTTESQGHYFDIKPGEGVSAYHLLGKDELFARALLNPQLLALAEYLCGGDFLLSQLAASVRFSGSSAMGLHIDAQWVPPTDYNPLFTACLALDDLSEAAGTTKVIPGSHKLKRQPDDTEATVAAGAIPIECETGAFSIWAGYSWHSNYPRTLAGERVMLHMTFCRLAYRPVEDLSHLDEDFLAKWPPIMATMLGRHSWLGLAGRNGGACEMKHYSRMWSAARR